MYHNTDKLYLAVALSMYFPINEINVDNPRRVVFTFDDSPELNNAIAQYWAGELSVDAKTLFTRLKEIRDRIH